MIDSDKTSAARGAVAVVGIACRFPGGVADVPGFWRLLVEGRDAIGEIPPDRIDVAHFFDPRPATPGRMMTRWGGFLPKIDEFDASFFGISPREAERMDPQQRLLLETAWEALEDAGLDATRLEGSATGVFVGQWLSDFEARLFADPEAVDFFMTTGSGRYAASGRISYLLGLRGPSLTLDTACSSSLAAVHLAVRSIRSGECALALAGGVNVILQPHVSVAYSQSRMMAPDGRCKFGDAKGDGYVRSEGAALIVLKPLAGALDDGDRIYAVIRGSALNNDGRSSGSMGTPSRVGQEELLRGAYRDAGILPGRVGYVEAHGTGTRAGDPVELGALGAVLGEGRSPGARALVGSVKTNVGHTEGAAGVAGLVKVALALHYGEIPPSLHFREPNPAIAWDAAPFAIPRERSAWPATEELRVGGVNAFGIAGTNAHVVLEQAPAVPPLGATAESTGELALLPLSARSPEALRALATRYAERLEAADAPELRDVCWSATTRRSALSQRVAFVAADRATMAQTLRSCANGEAAVTGCLAGIGERAKVAFVVPGQGAQWAGMARGLMGRETAFRNALERCDAAARPWLDVSIVEQLELTPDAPGYALDRIDVIQPVLVALAIAYAELWRSLGVEPDAVVGHSMGEVAAAHIAGVLDLDQAMRIICRRSALMRATSGQGAMALVEQSMDEAAQRLRGREGRVAVAVSNSPRSSVISGAPDAVQEVMAELQRDGVFCRLVKVDVASHSPQMEPLAVTLGRELEGLATRATRVPIYSTVHGRRAEGEEFGADYWAANLRQPVRFSDTVRKLLDDGVSVFVELGPHPVLLPAVAETAKAAGRQAVTIACGRRDEPELHNILAALGALWAHGAAVDLRHAMPEGGRIVPLPLYPWQRERHWCDAAEPRKAGTNGGTAVRRPDDEAMGWLHRLVWRASEPGGPGKASRSQWLVVAENEALGAALAGAISAAGVNARTVPLAGLAVALGATDGPPLAGAVVCATDGAAAYLPLEVLRICSSRPTRLWFVTHGAQAVDGAPCGRVSPWQAALWGAARVVAEEQPRLWGGLVDLDPTSETSANAAALAHHLLAGDEEDQVAVRAGRRYVLRLAAEAPRRPVPFAWRPDAAYLITGGLGDIGLRIARTMAACGARRLILVGRTPLPERSEWTRTPAESRPGQRIAALRALEALGVAVHVAAVDVGDEAALRGFLERYSAEGWPPIRGVVHAAGAFANQLAELMDRDDFDRVVRPKLGGAMLLDRLLPDLDLFVMFSSTGSFIAQPGQANYAAANAGLDAIAHDRRARGLAAMSIAWSVWEGTGLVANDTGARNVAEMARQGIRGFAPDRGAAMFAWLCGVSEATTVVLPADWAAFRRAKGGRDLPLLRELITGTGKEAPAEGELSARLASASTGERRQLLDDVVRDAISRVLKIAPTKLDPRRALGSYGLNSLMAMELRNRLEAALGRSLSATIAWNHPTIDALVAFLDGDSLPATPPTASEPAAMATDVAFRVQTLAAISDEEAALALLGRKHDR